MVIVGKVLAPRGTKGELRIGVLSDSPDRFSSGRILYLGDRPFEIRSSSVLRKGVVVLKLGGINSPKEVETLRGHFLTVPWEDVPPLPQDTYYHFQIIDMLVYTKESEYLGKVSAIISTGNNDVYVVSDKENRDLLVPAIDEVIVQVDVEKGTMTVDLPDGLRGNQ